jgi:hypothetical protein
VSRDPAVNGGEFITVSAFASDSLTVRDKVTINAVVRFDHNRAISPDARLERQWPRNGPDRGRVGHSPYLECLVATLAGHHDAQY